MPTDARRILVFGAGGQIGRELVAKAHGRAVGFARAAADITDEAAVRRAVRDFPPAALVNAAAYTQVDKAESEQDEAFRVNCGGAAVLARAAAEAEVPFIHISTDYVFDGTAGRPYREDDPVAPLGAYGLSKAEGDAAVRQLCPRHLILRTAWVYSPRGNNFVRAVLRLAADRPELRIVDDQIGCPTAAADIAGAILEILLQVDLPGFTAWGTYHYRGADIMSWCGFAKVIFELAAVHGQQTPRLVPIASAGYPTPARRPAYSVLATDKLEATFGIRPRPLRASLEECLRALFMDRIDEQIG
jgi:dTDP-4-dehydrorhamnose reductase